MEEGIELPLKSSSPVSEEAQPSTNGEDHADLLAPATQPSEMEPVSPSPSEEPLLTQQRPSPTPPTEEAQPSTTGEDHVGLLAAATRPSEMEPVSPNPVEEHPQPTERKPFPPPSTSEVELMYRPRTAYTRRRRARPRRRPETAAGRVTAAVSHDSEGLGKRVEPAVHEREQEEDELLGEEKMTSSQVDGIDFDDIVLSEIMERHRNHTTAHVEGLVLEAQRMEVPPHEEYFDQETLEDVFVLGRIPKSEIARQEELLEKSRIKALKAQEFQRRQLLNEVQQREQAARSNLLTASALQKREQRARERRSIRLHHLLITDQQEAFRKTRTSLNVLLRKQHAQLTRQFGELKEADDLYGAVRGRRYRVEWSTAPRLVRIRVDLLRALKNKVPRGRYAVMVTLYDRPGGHALRWSRAGGYRFSGCTRYPRRHGGKFFNLDLDFSQHKNRIFVACPAEQSARYSMCLVFELFMLRGRRSKTDRVVGWGMFPLVDSKFGCNEGQFRIPMLRGEVDPSVDTYRAMEELIGLDLDNWLCNLYFDMRRLPFYREGQSEYELEFSFTDRLLQQKRRADEFGVESNPDQSTDSEDGAKVHTGVAESESESEPTIESEKREAKLEEEEDEEEAFVEPPSPQEKRWSVFTAGRKRGYEQLPESKADRELDVKRKVYELPQKQIELKVRETKHHGIFKEREEWPARSEALGSKDKRKRGDALKAYRFAITQPECDVPVVRRSKEKLAYIYGELVSDLGLARIHTWSFWSTILFLLVVFWLRMLLHFTGQWMYLKALNVQVLAFEIQAISVNVDYSTDNMQATMEVGSSVMGLIMNIAVFSMFELFAALLQKTAGAIPAAVSRFLAMYGIATVFDAPLVFVVDLLQQNWTGDSFKLYNFFLETEGNGMPGACLTIVLTMGLMALAVFVFYNYLLYIHMNGRMLDIHHRLHADDGSFFVPHDFEISLRTLRWILAKSAVWKGFHGATRKVVVTSYILRDHKDATFEERTIHLAINTQNLYGEREIYRHFVRYADGSIREIFDTVELTGGDDYRTLERMLNTQAKNVGSLNRRTSLPVQRLATEPPPMGRRHSEQVHESLGPIVEVKEEKE